MTGVLYKHFDVRLLTFDPSPDKPCRISAEEAYHQKGARFSPGFEVYVD